ncbi:hypothetical protein GV794_28680, partial [Nocardia cyriacigeorgica]|nr:hypothetical protein [Nocardia cyriacigeorgica]
PSQPPAAPGEAKVVPAEPSPERGGGEEIRPELPPPTEPAPESGGGAKKPPTPPLAPAQPDDAGDPHRSGDQGESSRPKHESDGPDDDHDRSDPEQYPADSDTAADPRAQMSPEVRAEYDRLAAERAEAVARRAEWRDIRDMRAERQPIDDRDDFAALNPDNLLPTMDELRGRTMRVDDMRHRLAELDALERAAEAFNQAAADITGLEEELARLERSVTPVGEYDRLVQQRQELAREREFWRAKRDDRATRHGLVDDDGHVDEAALRGDRLEPTILRLYDEAGAATVDDPGGIDESPTQTRTPRSAADRAERRAAIAKLAEAASTCNRLDAAVGQVDRQLAELERAGVAEGRPRADEVAAELDRLAGQRAEALHQIKPRRAMRDDLAVRLRVVDQQGRPDEAALAPDRLDETLAFLRARAQYDVLTGVNGDGPRILLREIDALADAARDVNRVHNLVGRIQGEMAGVAGVWRAMIEGEGGRMLTPRVGVIVDGDTTRIVVFGIRDELGRPHRSDIDDAFATALRTNALVAQSMMDEGSTVELRRVHADRDGVCTVDELGLLEVERLSTGWVGGDRLDITSWRDGEGHWHRVDPTRPDWQTGRDTSEASKPKAERYKKYTRKDPPDGVSGWAMEDVVNDITLPTDDVPDGKVPESTLPVNAPQAPTLYNPSGLDQNQIFGQHWGADSYNVVRLLLMAAEVPKHPAVKAWIQRHPWIGRWVQARPWLQRIPPFGTVFRNYEWFAPPERNVQPMVPPWNASDHRAGLDDVPESLRQQWEREAAQWQRVQDWADAEYERFLHDPDDLDRIAAGIEEHRRVQQVDRAGQVIDRVRRDLVDGHTWIDPSGDVDAQIRALHGEIDRVAEALADQFAAADPVAVRDTIEDVRELLLAGVDPELIAGALGAHMRDDVPVFTPAQLAQIRHHLMEAELLVRDHADPNGRFVRRSMDRLADIAEAWNRLRNGAPLPQDFILLHDALAESDFLRANPLATWQDANAYAIGLGYHWDADRPPLAEWRAGIPYAPT